MFYNKLAYLLFLTLAMNSYYAKNHCSTLITEIAKEMQINEHMLDEHNALNFLNKKIEAIIAEQSTHKHNQAIAQSNTYVAKASLVFLIMAPAALYSIFSSNPNVFVTGVTIDTITTFAALKNLAVNEDKINFYQQNIYHCYDQIEKFEHQKQEIINYFAQKYIKEEEAYSQRQQKADWQTRLNTIIYNFGNK